MTVWSRTWPPCGEPHLGGNDRFAGFGGYSRRIEAELDRLLGLGTLGGFFEVL